VIGMVAGGAGMAVGAPLAFRRQSHSSALATEQVAGLWILNAAAAMILIGLKHGPLFPPHVDALLNHASTFMNLLAWPGLVLIAKAAAGESLSWTSMKWWTLPPLAYAAYVSMPGTSPVPFAFVLPVGFLGAVSAGNLYRRVCAENDASSTARRRLKGVLWLGVLLLLAQTARTAFPDVTVIREIVPTVMMLEFLLIAWEASTPHASAAAGTAPSPRYSRSALTPERADAMLTLLDDEMRTARLYRDTELTLHGLAAKLGFGQHDLSQALNQRRGQTLIEYLADWRVADARDLLADHAHDCYTVEALAQRAGFASRSAFYTAFRKTVGVTPTAYRARARTVSGVKSG
jgi:AraC-like DNA-binding protein